MANMHRFLRHNRLDLITRCQVKVASRSERAATPNQLEFGVPLFLDQLVETLELELTQAPLDSRKVSGPSNGAAGVCPWWASRRRIMAVSSKNLD
jgi:hypothetical protein